MSDLIDREKTIDAVVTALTFAFHSYAGKIAKKAIEALPSAERRGKWVKLYGKNYKCSECGSWWTCDEGEIKEFKYCPNCGAKMEENND